MNLIALFDLSFLGRRADAVALEFEGQEFTFRQLDERSNRLAHVLISKQATVSAYTSPTVSK